MKCQLTMSIKVFLFKTIFLIHLISALKILPRDKELKNNPEEPTFLKYLIDTITKSETLFQDKRRSDHVKKMLLESINQDLKALKQTRPRSHSARGQQPEVARIRAPPLRGQELASAQLDEQELAKSLSRAGPKSELLWQPYVEKKGRNDYLVIQTDSLDPFVTVVPNSIYYDIEKKCVNWLDACSLKGIREHLLKKVRSPYK